MAIRWQYFAALSVGPAAIWLGARRLAPGARSSLGVTMAATTVMSTIAYYWACPDPSDIVAVLRFYLLILPCVLVPVAAVVATRLARRPGELVAAGVLALLGWILGLVILRVVPVYAAGDLAGRVLDVAPPAVYAACGAVLAAARRR